MKLMKVLVVLATLAAILCGCGGGGSALGGGTVGLFLTDAPGDWDHLWVRVHKVELTGASDATLFESAEGEVIDLCSLRDATGSRFKFLVRESVREGTYTGIRVTLDDEATAFPTGSSTGQPRTFAGSANGFAQLSFTFPSPQTIAGAADLVVDFDLSQWEDDGTQISNTIIRPNNDPTIEDPDRHEADEYKGRITGLEGSAPSFAFTLRTGEHSSVRVQTDESTSIYNTDGSPNPSLANSKRVEVYGKYSKTSGAIVATSIGIKPPDDEEATARVDGHLVGVNGDGFVLAIRCARGFVPGSDTVTVTTNDLTKFFQVHGRSISQDDFYSILNSQPEVRIQVKGEYFEGANTLAASKVRVENEEEEREVELAGDASNLNAEAGTFTLSLREWHGMAGGTGLQVNVVVSNETQFKNAEMNLIDRQTWFAEAAAHPRVKVWGTASFSGGAITVEAYRVKLIDSAVGEPGVVIGAIVSTSPGTREATISAREWDGAFGFSNGQAVLVRGNAETQFKNASHELITAEEFFAAATAGREIYVEGWLREGVVHATRMKLLGD